MTPMTTAAEAEAAIAQVADLIVKLRGVIEQETALVHAGKVREASALAPQKSELTSKLYVVGERLNTASEDQPAVKGARDSWENSAEHGPWSCGRGRSLA